MWAKMAFAVGLSVLPLTCAVAETPACNVAIRQIEQEQHLPGALLNAIALVESGRTDPASGKVTPWPWSINVNGASRVYASKPEAVAAVELYQASGLHSIDVGCMQINLAQHPNAFTTIDQAFDPELNVAYAGRFLQLLYRQSGDWPSAIAAYHSKTSELGKPYGARVMAQWGMANRSVAGMLITSPAPPGLADAEITPQLARLQRDMGEDHRQILAEIGLQIRKPPAADGQRRDGRGQLAIHPK